MKLNHPKWFEPFGGASKSYYPSADGSHFFAQQGGGNLGFGMYVFRQVGTAVAEMVEYGELMDGRGVLTLGGNGVLYLSGSYKKDRGAATVLVVPKYVRFTNAGPMPVVIPVVNTSIDTTARSMLTTLSAKVKELAERKPTTTQSTPGVSLDDVWAKANDAIFASTQDGHLATWTWQKALDAAYTVLRQRGLIKE